MKPSALGVYIFAGGFTLGVQPHFDVLAHFEDGPFGTETSFNNLGVEIYQDINTWPVKEFNHVDLVFANPPCAPFSTAGVVGQKRLDAMGVDVKYKGDSRIQCIRKVIDVSKQIKPPLFTFESVERAYVTGKPLMDELAEEVMEAGYSVTHLWVNAVDCGVPQYRRRYFFVGHRGIEFNPVRPEKPHVTVMEAIQGLEIGPCAKTIKTILNLYDQTKPGQSFSVTFDRMNQGKELSRNNQGNVTGRPGFLHKRSNRDRPALTLGGGVHQWHPDIPRPLSVREVQVLCGFPPEYTFTGSIENQHREIGRGVTPPTANWLAGELARSLRESVPVKKPTAKVVNFLKKEIEVNQLQEEIQW